MSTPAPAQEYWLPGYELSRQVVLRQIQYFLGPSATVRPYSFQGREGYLINGMPLTKASYSEQSTILLLIPVQEQIQDLKRQSKDYERQQTIRMKTRRSGSDSEEVEPDINSIVVVGGRRNHQHRRPMYADPR